MINSISNSLTSSPNSTTPKSTTSCHLTTKKALNCSVLVIVAVFILLIIIAIMVAMKVKNNLTPSTRRTSQSTDSHQADVCQAKACLVAGKSMREYINFSVDPCENFYLYACGNWMARHPIPDDKSSIGTLKVIGNQLLESLKELLEQKPDKRMAKTVRLALELYRECMDQDTRDKLGLDPIKQLLSQIFLTTWPILTSDHRPYWPSEASFMETFTRLKAIGVSAIINFNIKEDANKTNTKIVYFSQPRFGLKRKEYSNRTLYKAEIDAFRKYMHNVVVLFAGQKVNRKELQARLDEMFELESKLTLASRPPEKTRNATVWYNKMTLADFKNLTAHVPDWTAYLRMFTKPFNLSYSFNDTDLVIVQDPLYYQQVVQIVSNTPTHVLYNYMGFRVVSALSGHADSQLRDINFEYSKAVSGIKVMPPLWKVCTSTVNNALSFAVSRLYVDKLVKPATKKRAEEMIAALKAAFKRIVETEALWLDETTRGRAIEKAAATHYYVGYPEWLQDNAELDDYYGFSDGAFVSVEKGHFMRSILKLKRFFTVKVYRELHKAPNITRNWIMPPAIVNAAAGLTKNAIVLPAGILWPPLFDPEYPSYMNFGGIGSVIGHEITHHFDDKGRQFDKEGNLVSWWTEETKQRFDNASQCFIKQYSSIVDESTGKNLNGILAAGENIADNGGVREAFHAFRLEAQTKRLRLMPHLEQYTMPQMFFLSYAQTLCSNYRVPSLKRLIDHDPHSPGMYRVNVPLSNFDEFAKAFNCSIGSKMVPKKRCSLW